MGPVRQVSEMAQAAIWHGRARRRRTVVRVEPSAALSAPSALLVIENSSSASQEEFRQLSGSEHGLANMQIPVRASVLFTGTAV